ncbi:MAG: DUF29 domain-containing protein [Geminicoccaceae bacterium]
MRDERADLYERDFYAWTKRQASELRRWAAMRPNDELDLAHIAQEIADLGQEQRNALRSWTVRIIEHLLLLEYSAAEEPRRHWTREVIQFRAEIAARMTRTLSANLARQLPALCAQARRQLVTESGRFDERAIAARLLPTWAHRLQQVTSDWWPHQGTSSLTAG